MRKRIGKHPITLVSIIRSVNPRYLVAQTLAKYPNDIQNKNHKGLIEEYHRKEGGKRSNSTLNNYFLLIENVENIIVQDALEEHQSCTNKK